ncbi:MAG: hypothetical protein K2V38_13395, partial [Gemmataceae bacterium]|nr:hypothetical protein [Gemmataceae bacterium]
MPDFLLRLPKAVLFALLGTLGGLLGAGTLGEAACFLLRPPLPVVREEPYTAPPPPPRLAATSATSVQVYAGGTATLGVRVLRDGFDGPVVVRFEKLPPGFRVPEVVIPEGQTAASAAVSVAPDVAPGGFALQSTATAEPHGHRLVAILPVGVQVLAVPPAPPAVGVSAAPGVQLYAQGTNAFPVRVARRQFGGDVRLTFENLPDGVRAPAEVVVPSDRGEVTVALAADITAKVGRQEARVRAAAVTPEGVKLAA